MLTIPAIIDIIGNLQVSAGNEFYSCGMFPSERFHEYFPYRRKDDNIFFQALTAFTLNSVVDFLQPDEQQKVKEITGKLYPNYEKYRSRSNPDVFNFYRTNPPKHYPNGYILSKFKHFFLADDIDTTSLIYLSHKKLNTPENAKKIRSIYSRYANLKQKRIVSTLDKYRNLEAYSIWMGSGRMPAEFDFCVLCNALYFIAGNKLSLNKNDLDSLEYLNSVIINDEHFSRPFRTSYNYVNTAIILYHITRLYAIPGINEKLVSKEKIIHDLRKMLKQTDNFMEKIILSSSLLKLGENPPTIEYSEHEARKCFKNFSFFIGSMIAGTENSIMNYFAKYRIFFICFYSEAYFWSLVLEYETLREFGNR